MSFEEEWERAKAESTRQASMRLNRAELGEGGTGGGSGDLRVARDDLGAIGNAAYEVRTKLSRDGDHARPSTFSAAIALTNGNFASGAQLLKVHDRWNLQLRTLLDACARISNHLDYSKALHAKDEAKIAGQLMSVSKISEYFK
ncbi:hypothetical protein [Streptomyces sp. NPDC059881]|uniref:hypothetical protein n=1 Tax=Streptomyces sp. NPDC059881 TaxID=3346986 RepID=UPI00365307A2